MKQKQWKTVLSMTLAAVFTLSGINVQAVEQEGDKKSEFAEAFQNPEQKYEPGVRWELPLGNTTKEELERELESFKEAGIGVVEVTATGQPEGEITEGEYAGQDYADVYGMGSEAWSRTLQTILKKANELGIRVDFHVSVNNGSNKHVPGISPNDPAASKELVFVEKTVENGELPESADVAPERKTFISNIDGTEEELIQNLQAVLLVNAAEEDKKVETYRQLDGSIVDRGGYGHETFEASYDILDFEKTVDITALYQEGASQEEITLAKEKLSAADTQNGNWKVMAFWWRGDCGNVSGVTQYPSYKIDYFSKDGTAALTDYYTDEVFRIGREGFENMEELLKENGGDIFADSYGANANWSNDLPEAFKEATGEEITKYLPALFYADSDEASLGENGEGTSSGRNYGYGFSDGSEIDFLEEYRQIMTELLITNQIEPLNEYCASLGLRYRDQVVYATSRLDMIEAAAHVDVPEVESLNNVDSPDYFNAMASTNHLLGKEVISSEHGATYGDKMGCYAYPIRTAIDQANRAFAGGINQLILHYYTYDSLEFQDYEEAKWPGFSAMGAFFSDSWRDNSPKWEHINIMTDYFSRMGYIMRTGTVKRDVAVYKQSYWWPRHQGILWADEELKKAGYTYDFLSGGVLDFEESTVEDGILAADTAEYRAFIYDTTELKDCQDVETSKIMLEAIEKFAEYAENGLPIICVGGYPEDMTGLKDEKERERFENALERLKLNSRVVVVEEQADVPAALQELGIDPAAENLNPSEVVSYRTQTEDGINYYYLYNCSNDYVEGISSNFYNYVDNIKGNRSKGENIKTKVALTGEGVPYQMNAYTGEVLPIADYEVDAQGRVVVEINLEINDAVVIALAPEDILGDGTKGRLSGTTDAGQLVYDGKDIVLCALEAGEATVKLSDGSSTPLTTKEPKPAAFGPWELEILSYTNKNDINAVGKKASEMKYSRISGILLDDLESFTTLGTVRATVTEEDGSSREEKVDLSTISGIATYTSVLTLPEDWSGSDGLILDVGEPYDTVAVTINGKELPGLDQITCKADVSDYVKAGENTVSIETNTTLSNALVHLRPEWYGTEKLNEYGLCTDVTAETYTKQKVNQ